MSGELGWDVTSSFSPVKSTGHVHRCEAIRARQGVGGHVRRWHLGFRQPRVQVLRLTHPRGDCAKTIFLFCSVSSLKSTSNDLIRLLRAFNVIMRAKCFPGGSTDRVCLQCRRPGLGKAPGEGNSNPLQYSCLENSMDRGAWWATADGVTKSWTRLSD